MSKTTFQTVTHTAMSTTHPQPPSLSQDTIYQHTFTVRVFSNEPLDNIGDELSAGIYNGCIPGFNSYKSTYQGTTIIQKTPQMIEREQEY